MKFLAIVRELVTDVVFVGKMLLKGDNVALIQQAVV